MPDSRPVTDDVLSIAVLSDLHAYDSTAGNGVPSSYDIARAEEPSVLHPMAALRDLIKDTELRATMVLCPGDLTDKAKRVPLGHAWRALHDIGGLLRAEVVAATAGNHDLDSRFHEQIDAKGMLQALAPPFPLPNVAQNDRYWARNYAIINGANYRLIVLNSSAYHGAEQSEIEHGRVSTATRESLRAELDTFEPKPLNVLLCHHHPQPHLVADRGAGGDEMRGGGELLEMLGTGRRGTWLVVHGHKHIPRLTYGQGGGNAPVVLSAASLCAITTPSAVRNQFHVITVKLSDLDNLGLVGTVRSWDWINGRGWLPPSSNSGLPALCGFGSREQTRVLAARVAGVVRGDLASWDEVLASIPSLDHLLPQDFADLQQELHTRHGLRILETAGMPVQIGRAL